MTSFEKPIAEWYANKIRGGIAEAACRAHFEVLGYAVESTGIEHIAPLYCKLDKRRGGNFLSGFNRLQKLPDFVISRVHPSHGAMRGGMAGKADAVMIEAKYRHEVVLEAFTQELLEQYKNLIDRDFTFIVYLVCKRYKHKADEEFRSGPFVFLNYFNTEISKTNGDTGWQAADSWTGFSKFPLYQGMEEGQNFANAYTEIVHPALQGMLTG